MNKQNEREPLWLLALFIFAALVGVAPLFLAACAAEKRAAEQRHNFTHEQVNILDELEKSL
jgi:hypothetical protein